jgi:hypothetical protein
MEDFHTTAFEKAIISLASQLTGDDFFCHPRRLIHGGLFRSWENSFTRIGVPKRVAALF